ncbi:MAG: MBL fold metallo-hydrolase [Alphaproteobacteria bacterium]|nr:MBL fold metallo-hydrolase [Alphaproteobacteria bacterium]
MQLVLLGTGCPQVDPHRHGPASLVRAGGQSLLFDCGSGVTQRLVAAGSSGAQITALFLTHLHSDHIVDLFQLVLSSWHQGRQTPQLVFGPPGTQAYVDRMMALWQPELAQRIAHERRPSTAALAVQVTEIGPGEVWSRDGVSVTAVPVAHQPIEHAFGYVVAHAGKRLVLSGDTAWCEALIAAARGADLLLHECFIHREMPLIPGVRTAEGLEAVAGYHTLSHEVGRIATAAAVGLLVLNHFVPTRFDRAALLAEVRQDFSGPILIGEDLMVVDLERGSVRHGDMVVGLPSGGS